MNKILNDAKSVILYWEYEINIIPDLKRFYDLEGIKADLKNNYIEIK